MSPDRRSFKPHSSKHGAWFVAQQQPTTVGGDVSRGLGVFFNATVDEKATNFIDNYQVVGAVFKGPFDARLKDDIGVGISRQSRQAVAVVRA
ncbi:hypothetical protein ELZ14_15305 [Pseudomonas brassicacearum]|nr:hypothetical protein ELZ14_15305 [Pseudomonas brassicacearum]